MVVIIYFLVQFLVCGISLFLWDAYGSLIPSFTVLFNKNNIIFCHSIILLILNSIVYYVIIICNRKKIFMLRKKQKNNGVSILLYVIIYLGGICISYFALYIETYFMIYYVFNNFN